MVRTCRVIVAAVIALSSAFAAGDNWRTTAERTNYRKTSSYAETVEYCRRFAAATPLAEYGTFGRSPQGREMPLLILSSDKTFTPEAARRSGKLVVLLQNCIHAGECAGKEASLALARDIAFSADGPALLEHVTVLIVPIFSVDGHERWGRYNRVNQDGPDEMGWRVTATNLNLNRDYLKSDTVEMRHWLRLWNTWRPDLFFDNHTTDGSDHQYVLLYAATTHEDTDPTVARWVTERLLPQVLPAMAADGHHTMPYFGLRDRSDPAEGVTGPGAMPPRFSTGYGALCNRPSILLEAHALKPFEARVRSTHAFLLHTLEALHRDAGSLRDAIQAADARTLKSRGADDDGRVPLRFASDEHPEPFTFKGVKTTRRMSDIVGTEIPVYGSEPIDVETTYSDRVRVEESIAPAVAYLVPPQWAFVRDRLELHGVRFWEMDVAQTLPVETYRFEEVTFAAEPYEGRHRPQYTTVTETRTARFAKGTLVVPLNQPRARIAVHLLEPGAADSLVAWGFFNAIFERKEYAEIYRFEPIAREMMRHDPDLKFAFEKRLGEDAEFAADPWQRINFFYRRSPYWDDRHNLYPVARLMEAELLEGLRRP